MNIVLLVVGLVVGLLAVYVIVDDAVEMIRKMIWKMVRKIVRIESSRQFKVDFDYKYGGLSKEEKEDLYVTQCEMYGFKKLDYK